MRSMPSRWIAIFVFLFSWSVAADPISTDEIPDELQSWIPWVLDDVDYYGCPTVEGESNCLWLGELNLDLDETGGKFTHKIWADSDVVVPLIGDAQHWPQDVRVNKKPAVVLALDEAPVLHLSKGEWTIEGSIAWKEMPEGIHVPSSIALVTLEAGGQEVPFPRRDDDGRLWLQSAINESEEGERLDLEVYRKLIDGVPLTVSTKVILRASGKAREVDLGPVLLESTEILSVDADIPARVDKDGRLRTQIHAGTHEIEFVSRTLGSPESLTSTKKEAPWPTEEIWVWQSNEVLRQVTLSGMAGVDPSRTNLPDEWSGLPAYLVKPGDSLKFSTSRRGEPEPPPDQIRLHRELWMDLTGQGYTVRDSITGELSRTWRLDLEAKGELGHVALGREDQLITENPSNGKPGVELRDGSLDLTAEWRIMDKTNKIPAVAWSENIQELGTTLYTPPGWTLLSSDDGVDTLHGTWLDQWDLFTVFFVLLVAMAIAKLTRWYFGVVALLTMILTFQESAAPFVVWVFLLVFLALLKVLPKGKLYLSAQICWWSTVVILIAVLVPFSVEQIRTGIYPQISEDGDYYDFDFVPSMNLAAPTMAEEINIPEDELMEALESAAPDMDVRSKDELDDLLGGTISGKTKAKLEKAMDQTVAQEIQQIDGRSRSLSGRDFDLGSVSSSGSSSGWYKKGDKLGNYRQSLQQDPKAIVQTGPGVPNWKWKSWQLSWSGPVEKNQKFSLYFISPTWNMVLSFIRVFLLILLTFRIIQEFRKGGSKKKAFPPNKKQEGSKKKGKAVAAAVSMFVLFSLFPVNVIATESPDESVLSELRQKLTRNADCVPNCVSTSRLSIEAVDRELTLRAEVHAGALSSFKIPGPANNWVPNKVFVDGKETSAVMLRQDGFIRVRLDKGKHQVTIVGQAPPTNAVTLELGDLPHLVTVEAPGWNIDGLREDGRPETSIQLTRIHQDLTGADEENLSGANVDDSSYPPWLEVTRTLDLGVPWLSHTTVRRVSPTGSPVIVKVPLLPGESVTESELQVENGEVVVSLGRDDVIAGWSSTLKEQPSMKIVAPEGKPWSEIWNLGCSPIWQCEFSGLVPLRHKTDGSMKPTFRPWPGEYLELKLIRPGGVEGQSTTIDSAHLKVTPGIRLLKATLKLSVRSSRGGVQTITLPSKASIQTLTVNGAERPFRQKGEEVEITLKPGSQNIQLEWQQPGGISVKHMVPKVSLGGPSANATVEVELPGDRWLLWVSGPSWGPAILFWGFLIFIIFAAVVLGFVPLSPNKSWQWALLVLGLTQIPVGVALIIVGWFFVLSWRKKKPPLHFFWHNSLQIVIGLWTLTAVICLIAAVYSGLAVQPDMQVAGTGSSNTSLVWYMDRVENALPSPHVWSVNIYVWKGIMLAWAMWLAWSLVKWGPWGWRSFSHELLWRSIPVRPRRERHAVENKTVAAPAKQVPKDDNK